MHTILNMKIRTVFLRLLLNGVLLFIGVSTQENQLNSDVDILNNKYFRLPNHTIPQHYDVELELYTKENNDAIFDFSGNVIVNIKVVHTTCCISLHAQRPYIHILNSTLVKEHMDIKTGLQPVNNHHHNISNILTFHFVTEILPGEYNLIIQFHGIYIAHDNTNSFFKISYENFEGRITYLAGTRFQAIGARKVFPCWDEPQIRATFTISVKHYENYRVLSNMPKLMTIPDKNEMAWSRFGITPAIPTYLVAIIIIETNFQLKIDNKIGSIWHRCVMSQYINFAETFAIQAAEHLHKKWEMNPQSLDIVAVPGLPNNGIANWGLIFYRETDIIYNKELDSAMQKIRVASLIAHEMVHHWYSNYISPSWWHNLWLNDGITMLLGMHVIDKVYPNFQILDLFVVQILHESLHFNNFVQLPIKSNIRTPTKIDLFFSFSRYINLYKASSILRMLQFILTDNVFWYGLELHLEQYKFDQANSDDLWDNMQDAQQSSSLEKRLDIQRVMNTWMDKTYYPVLNVKRDYTNSMDVLISIDNLSAQKQDKWWIPVTITTQTDYNFTQSFHHNGMWLKTTLWSVPYCKFRLPHNESGWIIINLQQTGYYRVNYDNKNWMSLASFLLVDNYTNIHVLNRAQIIDDAFHLMLTHKLDSSIFWNITAYLCRETNYIVWYPMFKALEHMSSIFPLQMNEVTKIKTKIKSLLTALLDNIGYNEDPNENDLIKFLRQEAAKWACILDVTECIHIAKEKLEQHLTNPENHKLLPWWKHWTYKGIKAANDMNWSQLIRKYMRNPNNNIIEAMAYYNNSHVIKIYLQIMSKENIIIMNVKDRICGFFDIVAKHARHNEILTYLLHEFEKIKPKEVNMVAALVHIINHVYTKKQILQIQFYIKKKIDDEYIFEALEHKIKSRWYEIRCQLIYLMNF